MNAILIWSVEVTLGATLLALVAAATGKLFSKKPALVHAAWLIVLVKFVTPPLLEWRLPTFSERFRPAAVSLDNIAAPIARPVQAAGDRLAEAKIEPLALAPAEWSADEPSTATSPDEGEAAIERLIAATMAAEARESTDLPLDRPSQASITPAVLPQNSSDTTPFPWQRVLMGVWLAGALAAALLHARRLAAQLRIVARSSPAPDWLVEEVERMAAKIGVRAPRMMLAPVASPFVLAVLRPRLVWPASLASKADAARYRGAIAHELAHLARRDHWFAWLELAVAVVWWWHPLAWLARRNLREAAEQACDARAIELVIAHTAGDAAHDGRRIYADLFLQLSCASGSGPGSDLPQSIAEGQALCVAAGVRRNFKKRLKLMFSERVSSRLSWRTAIAVAGLALLALPTFSLGQAPGELPPPLSPTPPTATPGAPLTAAPPATTPAAPTANNPLELPNPLSPKPSDPPLAPLDPQAPTALPYLPGAPGAPPSPLAPPTLDPTATPTPPQTNPLSSRSPFDNSPDQRPQQSDLDARLERLERAVARLTEALSQGAGPAINERNFDIRTPIGVDPRNVPNVVVPAGPLPVAEHDFRFPPAAQADPSAKGPPATSKPMPAEPKIEPAARGAAAPSLGIESLDLVSLSTKYAETLGEVQLAEKTFERLKRLSVDSGAAPQSDLDAAEIALSTAQRKQRVLRLIVEVSLKGASQEYSHSRELFNQGLVSEGAAVQAETRMRILEAILE